MTKLDLHADITSRLIAAIESDPARPELPWRRTGGALHIPRNALSGKAYNGINIVSLWTAALARSYRAPIWATYRQWTEKGAQVRRGEKSSLVVFYREFSADPDPGDESDDGERRMARASYVFNADQVEGFTLPEAPEPLGPIPRIARADAFTAATSADIRHGGEDAFFQPGTDHIQMPDEGLFTDTMTRGRSEGYYAVLLHELVHWSGGKPRLNRDLTGRFKSRSYAAEELVAEIGSAFLCAELGISQDLRADHAGYLASWLELLKSDPKAIFTASARASEAVSFLRNPVSRA